MRLPAAQHKRLRARAKREGVSLNALIVARLWVLWEIEDMQHSNIALQRQIKELTARVNGVGVSS